MNARSDSREAPASLLNEEALADIQGFITSGYGHLPLAAYLFLAILDAGHARAYLAKLIPSITTAAPAGKKSPAANATNVAFTSCGLKELGLPETVRCTFAPEFHEGIATPQRSAILGDTEESAPAKWEFGGPCHPAIHIVLLVHGATSAELARQCAIQRSLIESSEGGVHELGGAAQQGYRPGSDNEPFGFHDGIAQPAIAGIKGDGVPTGEFILGYVNHYGIVPPTPAVAENVAGSDALLPLPNPYHDATHLRDLGVNGSYVVYRKLQQDVAGFWRFMGDEAARITGKADAASMVWLASRCVGRWPSGTPLAISPEGDDPFMHDRDDFDYLDDPNGLACPMGAHVRRTHPRAVIKPYGPKESLSMSDAHRLLRRGRVFGPLPFDARILLNPSDAANAEALTTLTDDGVSRGIHFFCVNASIKTQFEFVQQTWCNNPRFSGLSANKDPVAGDNTGKGSYASYMTIPHGRGEYRTGALPRFVTVRAGAYLFMPSMRGLRFLAAFRS